MKLHSIFIFFILLFNLQLVASEKIWVKGTVTTRDGRPMEYVNVYFPDDLTGDVTDANGYFEIETKIKGQRELIFTYIGYKKNSEIIILNNQSITDLKIQMEPEAIEMEKVSVQASSFSIAEEEGVTFSALDVVTTAGAAADVLRAVQSFAGVNTVDDGAGIFVRGGDVNETKVLLDNGHLKHPYKYESQTGGYFGTFSPFLLSGTFFSSGGFSAQYGNALSGVLAMESLNMPEKREVSLGAGLAALSGSASLPLIEDKLGIRFSGNKSQTRMLFELNGGLDEFSKPPVSDDINLSLHYRYSVNGSIKGFYFQSRERIGVLAITPSYEDFYIGDETNKFYFINWRHMLNPSLLIKGTFSNNRFQHDQLLAALDLETDDKLYSSRLDIEYDLNKKITLRTGGEHQLIKTFYRGTVPYDPNDIEGYGLMHSFDETTIADISGAYGEAEVQLGQGLAFNYGHRFDYHHQREELTQDPRLSLVWSFKKDHVFRIATGRFHQFPEMYYYDAENGNPDLKPMQAVHLIGGWEWTPEAMLVRIEGYYKEYQNLILQVNNSYNNAGHGYARGVDFFVKRDVGFVSGWASYSYLQSRRKEGLYHEEVPTDYDVTHHFKVASKFNISDVFNLNLSYRYASGRPFHGKYEDWNSQRGEAYQKMDFSANYLLSFFEDNLTVLYLSVSNLLGHDNITDYTYSSDYSEVYKRRSVYKQSVYFGFMFNF